MTSEFYYSTSRTSNLPTTLVEIKYGFSRFVPLCAARAILIMLRMGVTSEIYYSTSRTSNLTMTLVEIKYRFSRFVPLCRKGNINYVANISNTTGSPNR